MKNTDQTPKRKHQEKKQVGDDLQSINVSPLLGQSSLRSESSDESDSEMCGSLIPSNHEHKSKAVNNEGTKVELSRRVTIQELVDSAGELTQTQRIGGVDDISDGGLMNTIVEFDDFENRIDANYSEEVSTVNVDVKVDENLPCPRWGNTMTMIDNSKVLIYGGQGRDPKTNALTTFSDLHVYDLSNKTWKKPVNCEGE